MTFSGRGPRGGVKQGELWTDSLIVGGSDVLQDDGGLGYVQSSGTQVIFSGTNLYVGGSAMALGYQVPVASIGSPVSKEQVLIQAGSGATGGGSTAWLTLPTAFGKAPTVILQASVEGQEGESVTLGSVGTGSFEVFTTSASQPYTWVAVGGP